MILISDFRDQDAVDRLRGHNSLVVGHRQVPQYAESRSQSVILLLVVLNASISVAGAFLSSCLPELTFLAGPLPRSRLSRMLSNQNWPLIGFPSF